MLTTVASGELRLPCHGVTLTSLSRSLELSASLGATDDEDINLSEARPLSSDVLGSCAIEF